MGRLLGILFRCNWWGRNRIGLALGAVVTLEQGGDRRAQEVRSGGGFISQSDLRLHFGLGKAARAEKIVIRWPSGLVETLNDLAANQYYLVREGSGVDSKMTHGVSGLAAPPGKP